tara:strand:+ start:1576 stop:1806 length:231 start_codon:yes stop_codon:yes gene_type:complete
MNTGNQTIKPSSEHLKRLFEKPKAILKGRTNLLQNSSWENKLKYHIAKKTIRIPELCFTPLSEQSVFGFKNFCELF